MIRLILQDGFRLILNSNHLLLFSESNHCTLIKSKWMVCSLDWSALKQTSLSEFSQVSCFLSILHNFFDQT